MFNPFFRFYLPGFRVGPEGVPGFNIDDNGLPQRAGASSGEALPEPAAQRYPDAAQTQRPPGISFSLPGAEGWVLSVPAIGSPGFRISPQDDVPGFNVGLPDDTPGFNVDGNDIPPQETTWSDGLPPGSVTSQDPDIAPTPTPPPSVDNPTPPAALPLPEWPYQFGTMLPPRLPTAFDPRIGPRIRINSLPGIGPGAVPGVYPWPPSIAPQQPPGIDIRARAATTQNPNLQSTTQQAVRNAWLPPLTVGQRYVQAEAGNLQDPRSVPIARQAPSVPPTLAAKPVADFNFTLDNAGGAGVRQPQEEGPPPQNKQTQQKIPASPPDTGLAGTPPALRPRERPGMEMTTAQHSSEQDLSQSIEECRRAAAELTQELGRAAARFGSRVYEDTILKMGSDIARLAERFADDPVETVNSILAGFPQTRVEGEFFAGFAAVFTILKNAVRGGEFERAALKALEAAKNRAKITVEGVGRSIPDILNEGITEIKSGVEINNSRQLRTQHAHAIKYRMTFNLVVGPDTRRVSKSVQDLVYGTGGTIQRFDPATGSFTVFK